MKFDWHPQCMGDVTEEDADMGQKVLNGRACNAWAWRGQGSGRPSPMKGLAMCRFHINCDPSPAGSRLPSAMAALLCVLRLKSSPVEKYSPSPAPCVRLCAGQKQGEFNETACNIVGASCCCALSLALLHARRFRDGSRNVMHAAQNPKVITAQVCV